MRIQHNISAMNSYRNYNSNVSKVGKNLEKLSSGYRINRAGDDAAGLAISEKMRIQISGLEQAQSNAKAGINLVQTAEGALTEVHDMLNRMYTLAEQSANGTFDNTTDRKQLQKEVSSLRTEINRIADSSNYNGIKLLDGSLETGGTTGVEVTGNITLSSTAGTQSSTSVTSTSLKTASLQGIGQGETLQISMTDDQGNAYKVSLTKSDNSFTNEATGKVYTISSTPTAGGTQTELQDMINDAISSATAGAFKATLAADTGTVSIKSTEAGASAPTMKGFGVNLLSGSTTTDWSATAKVASTAPTSSYKTVSLGSGGLVTAGDDSDTASTKIFEINGQRFVLAATASTAEQLKTIQSNVGEDVSVVLGADLGAAAGQLAQATGLSVRANATTNTDIDILSGSGKALTMQIGDTAESFNRLDVNIKNVHANSLGIGGISIANQSDAAAAMTAIKNATNIVSDIRGGLGALQNRLDHTINNLSVSEENITEAESTIRDTDVAKEMMAYTKNNILVQSAQAMLAQANQLPQGVLQLLG